jgi:hypothetical protein
MIRAVFALVALLLTLTQGGALAQVSAVPPLMNFQGRLAKPDGTPVSDGNYSITFTLFTAATGGTQKWTETSNPVSVKNGVFAVLLGRTTPLTDSLFAGSLFLEVKVGSDPALTPRQPLVSVGYALKADTVPDASIGATQLKDGAVTAGKLASGVLNPIAWLLSGNSGTTATQFLGTSDNQPLELRVNNHRATRYSFADNSSFGNRSVNVLGGSEVNSIADGAAGATIAGGGGQDAFSGVGSPNRVLADFGSIGGGFSNTVDFISTVAGGSFNSATGAGAAIGGGEDNGAGGADAAVGGGVDNDADGFVAIVPGGVQNVASGDYSFAAGRKARAMHQGAFVWADSTDAAFASTGANQFLIRAQGGVGINTNDPAGHALNVNGSILCAGLTQSSDARFKTDIRTLPDALDAILNLRGVSFAWDRDSWKARSFPAGRQIGFIAQEVEQVLPELVSTDAQGYKSVAYANVVPVLVEAMKAQEQRLHAVEADNAHLKSENAQIRALLKRLDALEAENAQIKARLGIIPLSDPVNASPR